MPYGLHLQHYLTIKLTITNQCCEIYRFIINVFLIVCDFPLLVSALICHEFSFIDSPLPHFLTTTTRLYFARKENALD